MVSGQEVADVVTKYYILSYNAIKPFGQSVMNVSTKLYLFTKPHCQNIATKFYNQNQNNKILFVVITIMMISIVIRIERFTSHTIETVSSLSTIVSSINSTIPIQCSNGDCDMAYTDSYGFFDDITNEAWLHKKHITTKTFPSWYLHPNNPEMNHDGTSPHWFGYNVHPMFTCDFMTRVGGFGDGGKWICDVHRISKKKKDDGCLIYSIGSNGQFEFENGMQEIISLSSSRPWDPNYKTTTESVNKHPCEIHIFDPSPNYGKHVSAANNMFYHAWGIQTDIPSSLMDGANRNQLEFLTFEETLIKLNHTNRHIDIFKIDCEGCEWTAYNDILLYHSEQITQILIEIHPNNARLHDVTFPKFFNTFRTNHFIPFYREPNPFDGRVHEYCFIRLRNFYNDI